MNQVILNLGFEIIFNEIPGNAIKPPIISLFKFNTKISNIYSIAKIIDNIEKPDLKLNITIKKDKHFIYFLEIQGLQEYKDYICKIFKVEDDSIINSCYVIAISEDKYNFDKMPELKLNLFKDDKPVNKCFFYCHRINTSEELNYVENNFGVELDLRDKGDELILAHDPFTDGELFSNYLKNFNKKSIILNIKSERIEHKILDLLKERGIDDYFFLDSSFPMIYKLSKFGEKNIAIRFSEYEPLDMVEKCKDMVKWVWVDCFKKFPLNKENYQKIKEWGLKICLVSPELQGHPVERIETIKKYIFENNIEVDAICCKYYNVEKWLQL